MKIVYLALMFLFLTSCTAPLYWEDTFITTDEGVNVQPEFVIRYTSEISSDSDNVCVMVNQGSIWEAGDSVDELSHHLFNNTYMYIDRIIVPFWKTQLSAAASFELGVDAEGNHIAHGAPINVCAEVSLAQGLHTVAIRTTSTSGALHTFSWILTVN